MLLTAHSNIWLKTSRNLQQLKNHQVMQLSFLLPANFLFFWSFRFAFSNLYSSVQRLKDNGVCLRPLFGLTVKSWL